MFYTKELSWGTLQRGGADVLGFLEKEKETALGSTTCHGGEMLRFGEKWHRIFDPLRAWARIHWRQWEQCQMMAKVWSQQVFKFLQRWKTKRSILLLTPYRQTQSSGSSGIQKLPQFLCSLLSQQEPSVVWFGVRWKQDLCRRWDQGKGLAFRKWTNKERLEKLLFLDPDEVNFHTFSKGENQWNHLCCGIFPSVQIEIASINS